MLQLPPQCSALHGRGGHFHKFKRKRKKFKKTFKSSQQHVSLPDSGMGGGALPKSVNWNFGNRSAVRGNTVKCYKCLYHGHQQLQCALAWCNRCATWGHNIQNCSKDLAISGGNRRTTVQEDAFLKTVGGNGQVDPATPEYPPGLEPEPDGSAPSTSVQPEPSQWQRNLQPAAQQWQHP